MTMVKMHFKLGGVIGTSHPAIHGYTPVGSIPLDAVIHSTTVFTQMDYKYMTVANKDQN